MKVLRRKFKSNEFGENLEGSEEKVIEEIEVAGYRELIEFEKMLANISGQTLNVRYDRGKFECIVLADRKKHECEYVSIIG